MPFVADDCCYVKLLKVFFGLLGLTLKAVLLILPNVVETDPSYKINT